MSEAAGIYRFEIDWADDGFADPRCDITSYVDVTAVRWGCGVLDDPRGSPFQPGEGKLPVRPRGDGLFHPGGAANSLSVAQLERPHAFRATGVENGVRCFDGVAVLEETRRNLYSVGELLTFNLRGHSYLEGGGTATYPRGQESDLPLGATPDLDPSTFTLYGQLTPTPTGVVYCPWKHNGKLYLTRGNFTSVKSGNWRNNTLTYEVNLSGAAPTLGVGRYSGRSVHAESTINRPVTSIHFIDSDGAVIGGGLVTNGRIWNDAAQLMISGNNGGPVSLGTFTGVFVRTAFEFRGDIVMQAVTGGWVYISERGSHATPATLAPYPGSVAATGNRVGGVAYSDADDDLLFIDPVNGLITRSPDFPNSGIGYSLGSLPLNPSVLDNSRLFVFGDYIYYVVCPFASSTVSIYRAPKPVAPTRPSRTVRAVREVGPIAGGVPAGTPRSLASYAGQLYMGAHATAPNGLRVWQMDTATGAASAPSSESALNTRYGDTPAGLTNVPGAGVGIWDASANAVRIIDPERANRAALRSDTLPTISDAATVTAIAWTGQGYYLARSAGNLVYATVGGTNTTDDIAPRNVTGMTWDGVRLWLVDATLDALYVYESGILSQITTFGPELEVPRGLALHDDGHLYTIDGPTAKLYRIDPGLAFADGFGIEYIDESSYGASPMAFLDELAASLGVERDIVRCTDPGTGISGLVRFGPAWDVDLMPLAYATWAGGFVFATKDGRVAAAWPGDVRREPVTIDMGDFYVVEPLLTFVAEEMVINEVRAEGYEVLS